MTKHKILIVDDEKDLRESIETAFSEAGFHTMTASNGVKGLEMAFDHKPDLILLDVMMPMMSGHEMLNKLRVDPRGKDIPVIFLTNFDDAKNISQNFQFKGDDYITKSSISLESIVNKVRERLAIPKN